MIQSIFKEIDARMGLWFVPQFNLLFNDADGIIEIASIINLRVIGTIDKKKCSENITIAFSKYGMKTTDLFVPLIREFFFRYCDDRYVFIEEEESINNIITIKESDKEKISLMLQFFKLPEDSLTDLVSNEERTYFEYQNDIKIIESIRHMDREDINILRDVTNNRIMVIESEIESFIQKNMELENYDYLTSLRTVGKSNWFANILSLLVQHIDWRKATPKDLFYLL